MSEFNDYQEKASKVAIYPNVFVENEDGKLIPANYIYPALGLPDEAGEVVGKIKKILRDKRGEIYDEAGAIDPEVKDMITFEIGDTLWYISELAKQFGINLQDVADKNIEKLYSREERGVLGGSGDNR